MEVALIRIDPNTEADDGYKKIIASIVVNTNLKTAKKFIQDRNDLVALTKTKFRWYFPGRRFPTAMDTTDAVLLDWVQKIGSDCRKTSTMNRMESQGKIISSYRLYVLFERIVLAIDPEGKQILQSIAVGDKVYLRCKDKKNITLPKPTLLVKSANHYFLHQYFILSPEEFRNVVKKKTYVPWTSQSKELNELKNKLEQDVPFDELDVSRNTLPVQTETIIGTSGPGFLESGEPTRCVFRFPSGIAKMLKCVATQEHITMTSVVIDCILSKYKQQIAATAQNDPGYFMAGFPENNS